MGKKVTAAEIRLFTRNLLGSKPDNDGAQQRFQGRLQDIAKKRGVSVSTLPPAHTWADVIEIDEERL